jgi:hypothetical protein
MKVLIELSNTGKIDDNIEAIDRVLNGTMRVIDTTLLLDTKSILEGIKKALSS